MVDSWAILNQSQIWRTWPEGMMEGFYEKSGLIDNTPMYNFILNVLGNRTFKRNVTSSTVDMENGMYTVLDLN